MEMVFLNIRGLNSQWKQLRIQDLVDNHMNGSNKILALVETRLQKDLRLQGYKTIQTSHNPKGGCLIATNIERQKNIKTILGNLAWTSMAVR